MVAVTRRALLTAFAAVPLASKRPRSKRGIYTATYSNTY